MKIYNRRLKLIVKYNSIYSQYSRQKSTFKLAFNNACYRMYSIFQTCIYLCSIDWRVVITMTLYYEVLLFPANSFRRRKLRIVGTSYSARVNRYNLQTISIAYTCTVISGVYRFPFRFFWISGFFRRKEGRRHAIWTKIA